MFQEIGNAKTTQSVWKRRAIAIVGAAILPDMTLKHLWKSWPAAAAVLCLILAAPALSQKVAGGPDVTVYESPT